MYDAYSNSNTFGCYYRYLIRHVFGDVFVVAFISVGECNDDAKGLLIAKAIGAIYVAYGFLFKQPIKNFYINVSQLSSENMDNVTVAFALRFKKVEDVLEYVEKLRICQIIP